MPVFKNSELQRRLQKSVGGYGGFDAPAKDYTYTGTESSFTPDVAPPKSNFQKLKGLATGIGHKTEDIVGAIAKDIGHAPSYIGHGLGNVVGQGGLQKNADELNAQMDHASAGIIEATNKLKDKSLTAKQRQAWNKVLRLHLQDYHEAYRAVGDQTQKIQAENNPLKGGASVARLGSDVITLGTLPFGESKTLASAAIRTGVKGSLLGLSGSVPTQLANTGKVSLKQTAEDVALNTVLAGLSEGGSLYKTSKAAKAAEEAKQAETARLFSSVDKGAASAEKGLAAEDAARAALTPSKTKLLGTGEETLRARASEIDKRLEEIRAGQGSKFERGAVTTDTAGTESKIAGKASDIKLQKNKVGGALVTSKDTTAGTFAPEKGSFKSVAAETRALIKEKQDIAEKLAKAGTPNPPTTLSEAVAQVETPPAPKVAPPTAPKPRSFVPAGAPTKDLGKIKRFFTSTTGALARQGESGRALAAGVDAARNASELGQAAFTKKIPTVLGLKKKEFTQFVDHLSSNGTTPVSGNVARAVAEWKSVIPTVRNAATKAGIDVGNLGENYFPKNYTGVLKDKKVFEQAVQHVLKTGQAKTEQEARDLLTTVRDSQTKMPFDFFDSSHTGASYGHLEKARKLDLPMFDKTKDSAISYVQSAFDRISHAEQFGANGETALAHLQQIAKERGHQEGIRAMDNYMKAVGQYNWKRSPELLKAYGGIKTFNRVRSLGLSAILNAGQTTNTVAVSGLWNTSKGILKSFRPSERAYIHDTGVILDSVLNSLREGSGIGNTLTSKLTAPGFNKIENFNRAVAAEAGKSYATKLAKKAFKGNNAARKILEEKLGITGDIGRKLTREQEIQASRNMVKLTQFKVDPQDLPGWMSSPEGKMVSQFRTFAYKQTGFVYNEVLKEAGKGNIGPLVRFLAVGVPIGIAEQKIRDKLKGTPKDPHATLTNELIGGLQNVGAFGLGQDVGGLVTNAKSPSFTQRVASTVGGPTAGLLATTAENIHKVAASKAQDAAGNPNSFGDRFAPLTREAAGFIPSPVGGRVANKLAPYADTTPKTQQEILSAHPGKEKELQSFFDNIKTGSDGTKTMVSNKIRQADAAHEFNKAQRLAQQHNAEVDRKIAEISDKLGGLSPDLLQYLRSTYRVNYSSIHESNSRKPKRY